MLHNCLANANFNYHQQLLAIDVDSANQTKKTGCRHCSATLHQANYPRIAFGLSAVIAHLYHTRFSFCCSRCRRRTTPPSVRFLGRRRYAATIFILLCASRHFTPVECSAHSATAESSKLSTAADCSAHSTAVESPKTFCSRRARRTSVENSKLSRAADYQTHSAGAESSKTFCSCRARSTRPAHSM